MNKCSRKPLEKLSDAAIKRLGPGWHAVGGVLGLTLRVGPGEAKSWVLKIDLGGQTRNVGIGSYYRVTPAKARRLAAGMRRNLVAWRDGVMSAPLKLPPA